MTARIATATDEGIGCAPSGRSDIKGFEILVVAPRGPFRVDRARRQRNTFATSTNALGAGSGPAAACLAPCVALR